MDYQTLRPFMIRDFKATNLPNIGFHGFRHTHASYLVNAGVDFKQIQHRMGHATLAMTLDRYSHLYENKKEEVAELLEKFADL